MCELTSVPDQVSYNSENLFNPRLLRFRSLVGMVELGFSRWVAGVGFQ